MILVIHILLSIFSVVYSVSSIFNLTRKSLKNIVRLTSASLLSGILLVSVNHSSFGHFCLSSFLFIGIIAVCLISGRLLQPSYR